MAFTKLTNSDFNDNGALSMPNRPSETKSAQEIKRLFDAPAREVVAPAYNRLIDELEAETGAASLGAVAPTGASGNTVQEILNGVYGAISTAVVDVREIKDEIEELSEEVGTFADDIETLQQKAHTHSNKDLLDTYNNTNLDITQAVLLRHEHQNKDLLDTYTNTNADISGAIAESHGHTNKALLDAYVVPNATIEDTVYKAHTHSNKSVLDLLDEDFSTSYIGLTYDGQPVGNVLIVNGKTGIVVLDASDVNALPNSTTLADLDDDSTHRLVTDTEKTTWNGKSTVSVTQVVSTGTKIATINVNGTDTDLYASGGGGGGSVDNAYKTVKVGSTNIAASGEDTLELVAGSNVTLTPDTANKRVTIAASGGGQSTGDMLMADYDDNAIVKSAGGIVDYVESQAYSLPTAGQNTLGGVKVGTNLSIDGSGVLSAVDTTYTSKAESSGGTAESLVTTGEKYNWNHKTDENPTFAQASTRANIASGESYSTILGKIAKWFNDLKDLAFIAKDGSSAKYLRGDGTWETFPAIPTVNDGTFSVQQNGTTKGSSTANQSGSTSADIITDEWKSGTTTVSNGTFSFSGLDDTQGYAFEPYVYVTDSSTNKNPTSQISATTGAGTSNMTVAYTTDADNGAQVKLRIIK